MRYYRGGRQALPLYFYFLLLLIITKTIPLSLYIYIYICTHSALSKFYSSNTFALPKSLFLSKSSLTRRSRSSLLAPLLKKTVLFFSSSAWWLKPPSGKCYCTNSFSLCAFWSPSSARMRAKSAADAPPIATTAVTASLCQCCAFASLGLIVIIIISSSAVGCESARPPAPSFKPLFGFLKPYCFSNPKYSKGIIFLLKKMSTLLALLAVLASKSTRARKRGGVKADDDAGRDPEEEKKKKTKRRDFWCSSVCPTKQRERENWCGAIHVIDPLEEEENH